ncbi:hypothetical protein [Nocardioides sp. YIM 152315]|uniref:hypothetical protein n=1 Tax=Nocardioides sp. YIM 152315 TaxID=3031760 RepID=UPI0023DC7A18|nr:hypothetical protein [Nocardioides sp. YIM 152315]MDF1602763.1 hypothetical protein [Nocardioides sp. YIM 152315]
MITALIASALLSSTAVVTQAPGGCHREETVEMVQGVAQVNATYVCEGTTSPTGETPVADLPPRQSGLDPLCVQESLTHGVDPFLYCEPVADGDPGLPAVTPGIVAAALRRIPLPPVDLVIQPPNGRTLVNFETNFYTEQGELTRSVGLLGRQVELRIWPAGFVWRFGDGEVRESSSPGAAYPDLDITHSYRKKGRVSPSVDVTYAAQFRVDGGPWQEVPGAVTIPGTPQALRVVTARPVLVGG